MTWKLVTLSGFHRNYQCNKSRFVFFHTISIFLNVTKFSTQLQTGCYRLRKSSTKNLRGLTLSEAIFFKDFDKLLKLIKTSKYRFTFYGIAILYVHKIK
jgi:hypothetical protein